MSDIFGAAYLLATEQDMQAQSTERVLMLQGTTP
jgi:hypothetical protein